MTFSPSESHRAHQAMGPGREFDTIRMLMARWGDLAVDIGDDAALLASVGDRHRVISTDACVDGVHFIREWISPREVGVRAAAAALSDLAAMGARADAVLIAMVVPDSWRASLGDVADGIGSVVRASGARIVGGNLSRGDAFSITTTVIGSAESVVSRAGAQPGDVLVVTGTLGGPGSAIGAWYAGTQPGDWARSRFVAPTPRLAEGSAIAEAGAHAMLDISDGLVADARHLAAASGVRIRLDVQSLQVGPGIERRAAAESGEEYELLAALPAAAAAHLILEWSARFAIPITVVGHVVAKEAGGAIDIEGIPDTESADSASPRVEFTPGHDHFSR